VVVLRFRQGAPVGTSLTGEVDRSYRCSPVAARVSFPLLYQVRFGGCWFLGPIALQWLCGLGILGS
jgi:hypothetical protein